MFQLLYTYNTIQYKTYNAPYVTKMLFVGSIPILDDNAVPKSYDNFVNFQPI